MKTLDEVIDQLTECHTNWARWSENSDIVDRSAVADALHYLKELREMTDIPMEYFENGGTSQELRNTSQITCPKCHSEFVILPEANNALTWSELKQMKGKPVWMEDDTGTKFYRGWAIVLNFIFDGTYLRYVCDDYSETCVVEEDLGRTWQAYRKERE